jgi:hypothetical protein
MTRRGQLRCLPKGDVVGQHTFIRDLWLLPDSLLHWFTKDLRHALNIESVTGAAGKVPLVIRPPLRQLRPESEFTRILAIAEHDLA